MRVILDTNVFVSGVFFSGPPYQILEAWRDGIIQLVISPEILEEYQRVGEILAEDHSHININPMLAYLIRNAEISDSILLPEAVCEDPDDDKFFACAIASKTTIIVSGDKHMLKASGYQKVEVIKPREFVEKYFARK